MRNYEVNFIVDSVLSGDEINATAQTYFDMLTSNEATIVDKGEMGLRQLAYPIKGRTTGVYFCTEFQVPSGAIIAKLELALRRDERIMRFLSVKLDKFGVKYNDDKRNGLIGKKKDKVKSEIKKEVAAEKKATPAKKADAPAKAAPAPVAKAEEEE
jgi:small subunit ribosomal protein S6